MNIVEQKNQAAQSWARQKEAAQQTAQKLVVSFEGGEPVLKRGGHWITEEEPDGRPCRRLVGGDVLAVGHRQVSEALSYIEAGVL